jgi:hypothetical protein
MDAVRCITSPLGPSTSKVTVVQCVTEMVTAEPKCLLGGCTFDKTKPLHHGRPPPLLAKQSKAQKTAPAKPWNRFGHSSKETNPPPESDPRRRRHIGSLLFKRDLLLIRCDEVTTLFRLLAEALVPSIVVVEAATPQCDFCTVSSLHIPALPRHACRYKAVPPGNEVPKEPR